MIRFFIVFFYSEYVPKQYLVSAVYVFFFVEDGQLGLPEVDHEVFFGVKGNLEHFGLVYVLSEVAFEDVILKFESAGHVAIPVPQSFMLLL